MPKTIAQEAARPAPTFEEVVLGVLSYEFESSDQAESERKIKRRLRDKKLGPYDADRVSHLRALKDDVMAELGKRDKSKFYRSAGLRTCDPTDWRFDTMVRHFTRRHPHVTGAVVGGFLPFAIYIYYLR